jgi:hypothetical protein
MVARPYVAHTGGYLFLQPEVTGSNPTSDRQAGKNQIDSRCKDPKFGLSTVKAHQECAATQKNVLRNTTSSTESPESPYREMVPDRVQTGSRDASIFKNTEVASRVSYVWSRDHT